MEHEYYRGEIWMADLGTTNTGSEQQGLRPICIIQNNIGNHYSPVVIVAAITGQIGKKRLPTHVSLEKEKCDLNRDSVLMAEHIRTIDKSRLQFKITTLDEIKMQEVDRAIMVSLGLVGAPKGKHEPIAV